MAPPVRLPAFIRLPFTASLALSSMLASSGARAQSSLDQKYAEGFSLSVFEPSPAGDRFFGTPDASSFTDSRLRLGVVGDYPTRWVLRRTSPTGQSKDVVSKQLYLHFGASYPLTDWLHANVNLPVAAIQKGDSVASPSGGKVGDLRVGLRANFIDPQTEGFAFGPAFDVWFPTGSPDNLTGDGKMRANPRLGISGRAGAFIYTANAGYLIRKKIYTQSLETGDAITFGAGVGVVLFGNVLQVGPEIWGNHQVNKKGADTEVTPVTAIFGAKVHAGDVAIGAGVGPGLSSAPGVAPRFLFSLALAPETHVEAESRAAVSASAEQGEKPLDAKSLSGLDGDGDGIADDRDACPDKLGDPSDDPTLNGCPKPKIADADGDGVRDELDACADVAGVATEDPKTNGCPPKLADLDGDGVLDKEDACPRDAGQPTTDPKSNGCPQEAPKTAAPPAGTAPKAPEGETAAVTFAGFNIFADGTSRIYVRLSSSVGVEPKIVKTTAEYVLHGARVPTRNNENPLLAAHFSAGVVSVRLLPVRTAKGGRHEKGPSDVRLIVQMREALAPEHRLVRNPDGSATLYVDFPRPKTPPPPEPDPVAPAPKASE